MHKIAILDQENNRVIMAEVPQYLLDQNVSSDDIAQAIFTALGISSPEYMIGEFDIAIDLAVLNHDGYGNNVRDLEGFTQDFKRDALKALKDA